MRYTHYSFLVFGHGRIPIVSWLRQQADESLLHAHQAGEMVTHLGAYPSLKIGPLLDGHQGSVDAILREALGAEAKALALYRTLLDAVAGHSVLLEEYARQMIFAEELHAGDVEKMLRSPGSIVQELPPEGKRRPRALETADGTMKGTMTAQTVSGKNSPRSGGAAVAGLAM